MAPGDACHGPRCSLTGLGPAALGCWPSGFAWSPLRVHVCAVSWATWLLVTGVPARCVALLARCPEPLGSCSPVCPLGALFCLCGVQGHLAPVHQCARLVRCFACAVSWATWLLFPGVPAWFVVLLVRCPGPLGSCSPVCPLGVLCCVCGVLGHLAPVHRCACSVRCFACVVSWATWLLFTGCVVLVCCLCLRCPGPLGSWSPVCPLGVLFCVCGVLGHLAPVHPCARSLCCVACVCVSFGHSAPVHRCARSVCCSACAVSWATWLLSTDVPARCVALRVRCPGPLGSGSPVGWRGLSFCVCGVRGHLAPVHRCGCSVCCFACVLSWATWLLFTGVPPRRVVLRVRCPGSLGSCSPVCPLGVLFCVWGAWATWLLFTGVPARCDVLRVRCPDSAPHPTGTTPGIPAHLAPAQHPPPATTRTAHRGNTAGQDSNQCAATHHNHAKRRASPGARPRTGRRTCPEHQHHTPAVP